jgi:VCBS repeat-containing protein
MLTVSSVNGDTASVSQPITLTSGALLTLNVDGSFSYDPNGQYDYLAVGETAGDSFTYTASDGSSESNAATVSITIDGVNDPPDCSMVVADVDSLWPPNGNFYTVTLSGARDPNGDPVTLVIYSVFQDELVGSEPDAILHGNDTVDLRAERDGNGDGRVYHIYYTVDDGLGGTCNAELRLGVVPHDQSGELPDNGELYDSTVPTP